MGGRAGVAVHHFDIGKRCAGIDEIRRAGDRCAQLLSCRCNIPLRACQQSAKIKRRREIGLDMQ